MEGACARPQQRREHPAAGAQLAELSLASTLLADLLGTTAQAEQRIQAFEAEIAQPLVREGPQAGPGRGSKTPYPDQGFSAVKGGGYGNNTGYLMARLQRVDPESERVKITHIPISSMD